MKKILLLFVSALMLTGCVSRTTTITINNNGSATIEKKLIADSYAGELKTISEKQFLDEARKEKADSIMRYKNNDESGIIAIYNINNIVNKDVISANKFVTSKLPKGLNCKELKNKVTCKSDFEILIDSEELKNLLSENGLTYKDVPPFILQFNLPTKADSHNAQFYNNETFSYIWEIPAGEKQNVNLEFSFTKTH